MSAIEVRRIGEALGAEVSGVDLARPIAPAVFGEIRASWLEHLVIRFRGQQLSDPQLLAFSRLFGVLDPASASNGALGTCWFGITAARCIAAILSIRARGG